VCGDNCVLRHEVPIFQEHSADSELIEEGRRNLQNRIQQRGFFDAKVESRRLTPKPGELDIRYLIHPGAQEAVDSVSFRGNHYFSADDLRDTVATRPTSPILPNFIPGARGNFSDAMVQDDAAAISSLYKGNGFAKVQVTPSVNRRARGKPDHIAVTFQINEGPQMLVGKVAIRGNQAISTAEIQGLLTSTPGQPYSDANVATDRDAILSRYYNAGYSEAQLNIAINSVKNRNVFDIAFNITEGPRQTVNKVFVRGERFVKPNVIQHQIQVHPGEALSQLDMLDTQRNLYNLGLFTDVNVAVENPTGLETSKNVIVTVREARRYTFNELVGLQVQGGTGGPLSSPTGQTGISPLLGFDVTRAAMTGRNQTLSFKSRYGTLQKRALLSYSMPQFLNHSRLNANFTTQYDDTFDVRTFRARRAQGSMQFEQTHSPTTKLVYRFEYRRVSLSFPCAQAGQSTNLAILAICGNGTLPTISEAEVPLLSRPEHLAMATSAWIRDRRDDPLNTFHGNFNTAELGLARSFGDFSNFTRGFFENASYYPLGKKEKTVLARATRLGVLLPFNKVAVPNSTIQQSVIPLPERFFSGGGDSLRGFSINQAGPRDPATGFPIGGNTLFINNVELRFPMIGENIGGVLFYDAGNVYTTFHDALRSLLRYNAPSPTDLNFTSHTLGTGIRYRTPVGPVRVDFGFNLNPPAFQTQQTICPNNQSTCPPSVAKQVTGIQQLSHFHFFFSIGQTF
jgi:outer membrane protein assembly complex protein YaeT